MDTASPQPHQHSPTIAAGHQSACFIDGSGDVWIFGNNLCNQTANSKPTLADPVNFSKKFGITAKTAKLAPEQLFVVATDGTVFCCGDTSRGQLGTDLLYCLHENGPENLTKKFGIRSPQSIECDGEQTLILNHDGTPFLFKNKNVIKNPNPCPNFLMPIQIPPHMPQNAKRVWYFSDPHEQPTRGQLFVQNHDDQLLFFGKFGRRGFLTRGEYDANKYELYDTAKLLRESGVKPPLRTIEIKFPNAFIVDSAGDIYCFGLNSEGQLGTGNCDRVEVAFNLTRKTHIQAPKSVQTNSCTFIVGADGTVWCCGANDCGQLGLGNFCGSQPCLQNFTEKTQISDPTEIILTGHKFVFIIEGFPRTIWCFGANGLGQLGLGDTINKPTPQDFTERFNQLTAPPLHSPPKMKATQILRKAKSYNGENNQLPSTTTAQHQRLTKKNTFMRY